jgi:hypothetical protein
MLVALRRQLHHRVARRQGRPNCQNLLSGRYTGINHGYLRAAGTPPVAPRSSAGSGGRCQGPIIRKSQAFYKTKYSCALYQGLRSV